MLSRTITIYGEIHCEGYIGGVCFKLTYYFIAGGKREDVSATSGIESIELFLYTALLIVI